MRRRSEKEKWGGGVYLQVRDWTLVIGRWR